MSGKKAVLGFVVLVLSCAPAHAQSDFDIGAAVDSTGMYVLAMEPTMREAAGASPDEWDAAMGNKPRKAGSASKAAKPVSLPYQPADWVRKTVVDSFYAKGGKDEESVGAIRQSIESGLVFQEYERIAPKLGLRVNNVVDAYAFYMFAQWAVANDYRPDPTPAQVAGVRAQAARLLAPVAKDLKTDAVRQGFSETLIAQGMLMASAHAFNVEQGNEDAVRKLVATARAEGAKKFAMDPTRLKLTPAGLVPADAVASIAGAAPAGPRTGSSSGTALAVIAAVVAMTAVARKRAR